MVHSHSSRRTYTIIGLKWFLVVYLLNVPLLLGSVLILFLFELRTSKYLQVVRPHRSGSVSDKSDFVVESITSKLHHP